MSTNTKKQFFFKNTSKYYTSGPKFRGGGGDLPPLPDASYGPGFQLMLAVHAFFFYKNKLYKNTQAEICPKIKNKLKDNHKAEILIRKI